MGGREGVALEHSFAPDPPVLDGDGALAIDPSGRLLAWASTWERDPSIGIYDLWRGKVVHVERECAALALFFAGGSVFVLDHGHRPRGAAERRIVELHPAEGAWKARTAATAAGEYLGGASPDGARLFLWATGRGKIVRWPSLDRVFSWQGHALAVDWEAELALGQRADGRALFAAPLGGGGARIVPLGRDAYVGSWQGNGLVALGPGLSLASMRWGWTVELSPGQARSLGQPSLRLQGEVARVRLLLGGLPRHFDVDLERGVVRSGPADAAALARRRGEATEGAWHPALDVVAYARRWPRSHLRGTDGSIPARLPRGSSPCVFSPEGERLVCIRRTEGAPRLEIWRVATRAP